MKTGEFDWKPPEEQTLAWIVEALFSSGMVSRDL